MKRSLVRPLLYGVLLSMILLHNDIWLWDNPRQIMGIPVGFAYHIAFCVAASLLMILLVTFAWPAHLEADDGDEPRRDRR